jgi:DNA polymerase I-like protein with 3'-5' exonuclease and polymerase domains
MEKLWRKQVNLEVGGYTYEIEQWDGDSYPLEGDFLAIDTETEPLVPGEPAVPVLMQVCSQAQKKIHLIRAELIGKYLDLLEKHRVETELVFHNAPFDLEVLGILRRDWLVAQVDSGRITDTGLRYLLSEYEKGALAARWGLDYVAAKLLKIEISKEESLRLSFRAGEPLTALQIQYAALDAAVTAQIRLRLPDPYPTEWIQVRGFVALHQIGNNGMKVDEEYLEALKNDIQQRADVDMKLLNSFKYYPGMTGNQKILQHVLENIEKRGMAYGQVTEAFPRTEKREQIQKSEDLVRCFSGQVHPFIVALINYDHLNKLLETYCGNTGMGVDGRVHPFFQPLMRTGRTSCRSPNLQNIPTKEGIRGIYVAASGRVLFCVDYSQIELCCLAQHCLKKHGESKMAEIINAGEDLHSWFGEKIRASGEEVEGLNYRQIAKAANFGFPGGLGAKTFQHYARGYGIMITVEQSADLRELWLKTFPEMDEHLHPDLDSRYSYTDEDTERYLASTYMGRKKGRSSFCAACNYPFQGLAADGAKLALWQIYKLERKSNFRVVNFVHDEVIVELLEDDKLQKNIKLIQAAMVYGMQRVCPDILVKTEGALMYRWDKAAKPVHDEVGNLLVWTGKSSLEAEIEVQPIEEELE